MHKLTFVSLCNSITCHWKALSVSWSSARNFWQCEVPQYGENPSFCIIHMPQLMRSFNCCHMMCHLAGTHAVRCITLHVFGTPIFLSECTKSNISCHVVVPGINHDWVRWKISGGIDAYQFVFCFLHPWMLASETFNVLLHCMYLFSWRD